MISLTMSATGERAKGAARRRGVMVAPVVITAAILSSVLNEGTGFSFTASTAGSNPALSSSSSPACSWTGGSAGGSIGWIRRRQPQHHGGGADVNGGGGCGSHFAGTRRSPWKACFSGQGGTGGEQQRHPHGSWRGAGAGAGAGGGIAAGWYTEASSTNRQRWRGQRQQQQQQQIPQLAPLWAASGGNADSSAIGEGTGGLLFGDPGGSDDDDEDMVVEVDEEELREEWAARGLSPEAFDPLLLLQMWEEEEEDGAEGEDGNEDEREAIDAMMAAAAATAAVPSEAAAAGSAIAAAGDESADASPQGGARRRLAKERKGFGGMDGGEADDDGVDVDAVMEAAAAAAATVSPRLDHREGAGIEQPGGGASLLGDEALLPAGRPGGAGGGAVSLQGRAVGIDLGTTNSAVAVIVDGQPVMVPNSRGSFTTPSVVSFKLRGDSSSSSSSGSSSSSSKLDTLGRPQRRRRNPNNPRGPAAAAAAPGRRRRPTTASSDDPDYDYAATGGSSIEQGEGDGTPRTRRGAGKTKRHGGGGGGGGGGGLARIFVGEAAAARIATDPKNTYSSVKRIVGRTKKEAKEAGVGLGALNVDQSQQYLRLKCPAIGAGATIPPEELSAEILRALIRDAERFIGGGVVVKRAVVTVPAYFNPIQCAATERAAKLAGLDKVKLMREPEAAALAYGLDKGGDELILVFDLGGGTFDVSVLEVGGGIAEVIATAGDSQLGGDDFDQAVTEWLFDEITGLGGGDPRSSPVATRRLIEKARAARERLSNASETEVEVTFACGQRGSVTLTRAKMESLIMEPLKRVMAPMREVAIMADISLPGDTGAFMNYDLEDSRELREGVSGGGGEAAERQGGSLRKLRKEQAKARKKARSQSKSLRKQVSSMAEVARSMDGSAKLRRFPQGGRMVDKVVLVGGATRMPCVQRLVGGITGVKPKRTVDPDRAVALGAAAFAGILEGEVEGQEVMTSWQASVYRMMARNGMVE